MTNGKDQVLDNEQLYTAYMDGELGPQEARDFERFLTENPDARKAFEQFRQAVGLVRKVGRAPAPPSLLPSLQTRVGRWPKKPANPLVRFPYEVVLFLFLLVVSLYGYFFVALPPGGDSLPPKMSPSPLLVTLERNPGEDLLKEFRFEDRGSTRRGERWLATTCGREEAARLLERLTRLSASPLQLPAQGDRIFIVLTFPQGSEKPEGEGPHDEVVPGIGKGVPPQR